MTSAPDVVVVGAGAIGAACALELARRGARVELLERGGGWAPGCSAGNAGLIVPSHATPLATPAALRDGLRWVGRAQSPLALHPQPVLAPWLARFALACVRSRGERGHAATALVRALAVESLARWRALAPEQLERRGVLTVYAGERGFDAGRAEAAAYAAAGLRCELLDGREARALEPALRSPVAGAVLYPDEAHGDPRALVSALGAAACAAGARLRTGVEVRGLRRGGGVLTAAGEVPAGRVVLAAGTGTRALGVRLPVLAGVGCSVDVLDGVARPARPLFLHEARVVATPLAGPRPPRRHAGAGRTRHRARHPARRGGERGRSRRAGAGARRPRGPARGRARRTGCRSSASCPPPPARSSPPRTRCSA